MPKVAFSEKAVPSFADAPAAVLVVGDVEFFVEEAAARARETLADPETEVLAFEDDAPVEAISDALLNRSLFSPRRLVQLDISRIVGTEAPGRAVRRGGRGLGGGKAARGVQADTGGPGGAGAAVVGRPG